jgi:hypothetical protein
MLRLVTTRINTWYEFDLCYFDLCDLGVFWLLHTMTGSLLFMYMYVMHVYTGVSSD